MEDRINVGESSCNFGDGMDQRVQSLMMMMMMMMMILKPCDLLPCAQQGHVTTLKMEALPSFETSLIVCPTAQPYNTEELSGKSDKPFLNHRH